MGRGSGTQRGGNKVEWGRDAKDESEEAAGLAEARPAMESYAELGQEEAV